MPRVLELEAGDPPGAWAALGFAVRADTCAIGTATIRLTSAGGGLLGWTLAGRGPASIDGLPTRWAEAPPVPPSAPEHPNGAFRLDHVVVLTPSLERTVRAFAEVEAPVRRIREEARQAFLWVGDLIVEIVERGEAGPARFWGLVVVVPELGADARDAVQPGRRIAPVPRAAGLGVPLAFMTPHVPAPGSNPPGD